MKKVLVVVYYFSVNLGVWGMYPDKDAAGDSRGNNSLFSIQDGGSSSEQTRGTAVRRFSARQRKLSPVKGRSLKLESGIRKDRSFFTKSEVYQIIAQFDEEKEKLELKNRQLEEELAKKEMKNRALRSRNRSLANEVVSSTSRSSEIINLLRGLVTRPSNNDKPYLEGMSDYCRDIISYGPGEQVSGGSMELFDNVKHKQMQEYMSKWSDKDIQQYLPEFVEFTINSFREGVYCLYEFDRKIQQQCQELSDQNQEQQRQIQELSNQDQERQRQIQKLSDQDQEQQRQIQKQQSQMQRLSDQNRELQDKVRGLLEKEQERQISDQFQNPQIQELLMQNQSMQEQMLAIQERCELLEKEIQLGQTSANNEVVASSSRTEEDNGVEERNLDAVIPESTDMSDVTRNISLDENSKWSFSGQIEENLPNGFGRLFSECMGAYISGNFVSGNLKIEKSIRFKESRSEEKELKIQDSFNEEIFLPKEYLLAAQESVVNNDFLCFVGPVVFSEVEPKRLGVVFGEKFVYWGDLDQKTKLPSGDGMMIRCNGSTKDGYWSTSDWLRNV